MASSGGGDGGGGGRGLPPAPPSGVPQGKQSPNSISAVADALGKKAMEQQQQQQRQQQQQQRQQQQQQQDEDAEMKQDSNQDPKPEPKQEPESGYGLGSLPYPPAVLAAMDPHAAKRFPLYTPLTPYGLPFTGAPIPQPAGGAPLFSPLVYPFGAGGGVNAPPPAAQYHMLMSGPPLPPPPPPPPHPVFPDFTEAEKEAMERQHAKMKAQQEVFKAHQNLLMASKYGGNMPKEAAAAAEEEAAPVPVGRRPELENREIPFGDRAGLSLEQKEKLFFMICDEAQKKRRKDDEEAEEQAAKEAEEKKAAEEKAAAAAAAAAAARVPPIPSLQVTANAFHAAFREACGTTEASTQITPPNRSSNIDSSSSPELTSATSSNRTSSNSTPDNAVAFPPAARAGSWLTISLITLFILLLS